jgi:hypothetical protein
MSPTPIPPTSPFLTLLTLSISPDHPLYLSFSRLDIPHLHLCLLFLSLSQSCTPQSNSFPPSLPPSLPFSGPSPSPHPQPPLHHALPLSQRLQSAVKTRTRKSGDDDGHDSARGATKEEGWGGRAEGGGEAWYHRVHQGPLGVWAWGRRRVKRGALLV